MAISDTTIGRHDGLNLESSSSGIHWGAILGGAAAAAAMTLILIPLGTALGFSSFSVFKATAGTAAAVGAGAGIWLIIVQWISSGIGGYLAGRMRVKWADTHSDEVFFRDTAHGLLAWAVATLVTVGLVAGIGMSAIGAGVQAGATAAAGAAQNDSLAYYGEGLFRGVTTPSADASAEATRILTNDLATGAVTPDDKAYLSRQVAARTGLSTPEADARVDSMLAQIETAKQKTAAAAETARKAAVTASILLCLSLFIGAFIASVSAALGGRLRDKY